MDGLGRNTATADHVFCIRQILENSDCSTEPTKRSFTNYRLHVAILKTHLQEVICKDTGNMAQCMSMCMVYGLYIYHNSYIFTNNFLKMSF